MSQTYFLPDEAGETKRPDLISALGLLTFINTGIFILIYSVTLLAMMGVSQMPEEEFVSSIRDAMGDFLPAEGRDQFESMARILHANGVVLMFIYLARTAARLWGAIGIWRGKRSGFHIYAAAQLIGLFLPHIILPWSMIGFFGPLMTVAVTAMYGSQLKRLG